jgi:hypothetical protein
MGLFSHNSGSSSKGGSSDSKSSSSDSKTGPIEEAIDTHLNIVQEAVRTLGGMAGTPKK